MDIQLFIEVVTTSNIRRTADTKRRAYAGRSAISIAKKNGDPLFKQYINYRQRMLAAKNSIQNKYGSSAKIKADNKIV